MKYLLLALLLAITAACGSQPAPAPPLVENNFKDPVLRQIYDLQNTRSETGLISFLADTNPVYREAALYGFASLQPRNPATLTEIAALLEDNNENIRCAAAYALGQAYRKEALPFLVKAHPKEKSPMVKGAILEAVGKCTDPAALSFLTGFDPALSSMAEKEMLGLARGLYRSLLGRVVSEKSNGLIVKLLAQEMPESVRFMAAQYLSRARRAKQDLSRYSSQLLSAFGSESDLYTQMALVNAMFTANHPEVLELLKLIILPGDSTKYDYRLRVNALNALGGFDAGKVKETILKALTDRHAQVAVAASEYFLRNGSSGDAARYFEIAKKPINWRARANLLTAALKYSQTDIAAESVSQYIIRAYNQPAGSKYEKAYLLAALSGSTANFRFVENQVFANTGTVISSYGMSGLANMCRRAGQDREMKQAFSETFKRAVGSGDSALMTIAAGILSSPKINFKSIIKDTGFLKEALDKATSPEDIEAWLALKRALDFFNDVKKEQASTPVKNSPVDWQLVASIQPDQQVVIKTARGNITVQLMVNEAPASVANFIRLIKQDFYKKSVFHRVAANFVIQGGCPRGDGWGGPAHTIASELGPSYYGEGTLGMASAGKDTEGSQWFITHSPTPHLDGRYTIFGRVVAGMDVVHKVQAGDAMHGFEIL